LSGRGDHRGAAEAGRRLLTTAADDAVKKALQAKAKPTLARYSWSRFHSDLLDDNRWALVALRAQAPIPIVEAMVMRLEAHANRSQPRGYVGDFDAEAMAARWNVDAAMVIRILAELEGPQIGWIDQDQVVNFWSRNPDKVDETNAQRQQRFRDRKRGMKRLAEMARQGLIDEAQRHEREVALKNSKEPAELIAAWATVTRYSVTVTPRAEQIINQDIDLNATPPPAAPTALGTNLVPIDPEAFADEATAFQWLTGDGEALVAGRLDCEKAKARQAIERWVVALGGSVTGVARTVHAALSTGARKEAFRQFVTNQVARQAAEMLAPRLPLPPVPMKGGSG
jgi:hypothetical protein